MLFPPCETLVCMWGAALYMMRIDMPCTDVFQSSMRLSWRLPACVPVTCNGFLEASMRMVASRHAFARGCIPQQMRACMGESLNPRTLEQEKESELSQERERARMLQEELMKAAARGDKAASDEVCGCAGASASDCVCASAAGMAARMQSHCSALTG